MKELSIITQAVCDLAREVGKFQLEQQNLLKTSDVTEKSPNQLVSYVDQESESRLIHRLQQLLPEAGFITEEKTVADSMSEWFWIIDPLDGTTNYIHHLPIFSISIGLVHHQEVVAGVIYDPSQDECFSASKNNGAFLNGKRINVSDKINLKDTLVATGFPYYDFSKTEGYLDMFRQLMCSTRGIRRLGSAAIDLAYVACGRFDAFWEYGL
ncbi:MAG: inositol monophosphatase family protein, partial [Bacteroidales bacterium]|nr:inositol monophosphatase family protein [Bacteroidales bacterium]